MKLVALSLISLSTLVVAQIAVDTAIEPNPIFVAPPQLPIDFEEKVAVPKKSSLLDEFVDLRGFYTTTSTTPSPGGPDEP